MNEMVLDSPLFTRDDDTPSEAQPETQAAEPQGEQPETAIDALNKTIAKSLHARAKAFIEIRKKRTPDWKKNIDLRLGHRAATIYTGGITNEADDDNRSEINPDWSLTKTKTANLFSQVPAVQLTHENKTYAAAIPPFAKALNYELGEKRANVGAAMEEALNDAVNAAGVAAIEVGYAARFEHVDIPAIAQWQPQTLDPATGRLPMPIPVDQIPEEQLQQLIDAKLIPTKTVPRVTSDKFFANRFSPNQLIVPSEFVGSCFDDGDFVGRGKARMPWADAKHEFKLTDEDKDRCTSGSDTSADENLQAEPDKNALSEIKSVQYTVLYYWRHRVDPDEKHFRAIWKLVYVDGIDEPVVHEPWTGQEYDEQSRRYVGATRFPIRLLTLTYITDNPIPPSDSAAARAQVDDLRRSRSQMFMNRERSVPLRWINPDRVGDATILATIMRGTWQGLIPIQGGGDRAVGEVARSSYPPEDFTFDAITKADLMESWQIGPNQQGVGTSAKQTSAQVNTTQQNFSTRIGQERGRVAAFFTSIAEVLAGLMALYSDFPMLTDQERGTMQQAWDSKHILHDLVFKIRPDSTIVLDSQQRIQRLMQYLNMTAKSGYVNVQPIIVEITELMGLDPSEIVVQPQPKPEEPNISLRLSGKEDLTSPMVLAMLAQLNKLPQKQHIQAALQLLEDSLKSPEALQAAPPGQPPPGGGPHLLGPGHPPAGEPPMAAHPPGTALHNQNPDWVAASKVIKRSRDVNEGSGG